MKNGNYQLFDAARILEVSLSQVIKFIREGKIQSFLYGNQQPEYCFGAGERLVSKKALEEFIKKYADEIKEAQKK